MISVQKRPVPATNHGFCAHAARSRAAACARCGREPVAGAEFGEGARQILERYRPGRHGAAVDRAMVRRQWRRGQIFQHGVNLALHRMLGLPIAAAIRIQGAGETEKAGMLAGAIVVQGRGRAGPRQRESGRLRQRPMRPAAQRRCVEPGFRQHAGDAFDMGRFAAVRGAGERELFIGQLGNGRRRRIRRAAAPAAP